MRTQRKRMVLILVAICTVLTVLAWDSMVTQRRNEKDEVGLQQIRIGMSEDDVAKLMRRTPFPDPMDMHRKYVFVWKRTPLMDMSWRQPTVGKTITLVDGRVSDVYVSIIHR